MDSKTATALGAGIVTVITPLVFPTIPFVLGMGFFAVAGGLFIYAGREQISGLFRRQAGDAKGAPAKQDDLKPQERLIESIGIHYDPSWTPAELPLSLVKRLAAEPIHIKTLTALRTIAASSTPEFHLKDVIEAISGAKTYQDVRGIWSGLTRRTRSILNDTEVDLICWRRSGIHDEVSGEYVDHIGRVSPLTHASLRTYFGMTKI